MKKICTLLIPGILSAALLPAQCNPDTEPPAISAVNVFSVNIMPTGMIMLWAADFIQTPATDNCTPANQLQIAVRKAGSGSGFPLDPDGNPQPWVVFNCCELGTQAVELWVRDAAGNAGKDTTYVIVQDNASMCGLCGATVKSCAYDSYGEPVAEMQWTLSGQSPALPPFQYVDFDDCLEVFDVPYLADFSIVPFKDDNPLNGVSTFDLVLINKHILAVEPLGNPYKMIAADVNKSRTISTFDVVELRKLILGIYTEMPHNTSWRFILKDYVFPDSLDPFAGVFPGQFSAVSIVDPYLEVAFTGIKVGDVNFNALSNVAPAEERGAFAFQLDDALLRPGETARLALRASQPATLAGMQFALQFDPALLDIRGVSGGEALGGIPLEGYYARPEPGLLTFSWDDPAAPAALEAGAAVLYLEIRTVQAVQLSRALSLSPGRLRPEAYGAGGAFYDLEFRFGAPQPAGKTEIFPAAPNPSAGPAYIPVALAEPAAVSLELYDLGGRRIFAQERVLPAGLRRLEIPAEVLGGYEGVLFYRVNAGAGAASGKLFRCAKP